MYRSESVLAAPAANCAQQELKPVYRSIGLGWWKHVGWRQLSNRNVVQRP